MLPNSIKYTSNIQLIVMIRFFGISRVGAYWRQGAYLGQGTYFLFFEKQPNVRNKTLINIKITNNNKNCNSNKLMKVQLLLKGLLILAVNIYMYGTVNVHEFIYLTSMTSVGAVTHNREAY